MNRTIIGSSLDQFFEGSEDVAKKIYTHPKYGWQIWEVEDSMYGFMCEQSEDEFVSQAGDAAYWRSADGTVLRKPNTLCKIRDKELYVWNVFFDEDLPAYDTLLDYLAYIGISTETNLIAAFKDLAKCNRITIEELLNTYEGQRDEG